MMATKNLARTVIEGGRRYFNCWLRRYSNARIRSRERDIEAGLPRQIDFDGLLMPKRAHVHRWFHDKLGPLMRWLERQVGRPWRLVHGEVLARFDTRTTPGRHIVHDHLLRSVDASGAGVERWAEFIVDGHGILRRAPQHRSRLPFLPAPLPLPQAEVEAWLAGRRIDARGGALFWFTSTAHGAFRQDKRLSDDDVTMFLRLPVWFRQQRRPAAILPNEQRN
jgi:hypothetical protein